MIETSAELGELAVCEAARHQLQIRRAISLMWMASPSHFGTSLRNSMPSTEMIAGRARG